MRVFEITVPVTDVTHCYILREFIGEGSFGEDPVAIDSALPTRSLVIGFRGQRYLVNVHDITKAVCAQVVSTETLCATLEKMRD